MKNIYKLMAGIASLLLICSCENNNPGDAHPEVKTKYVTISIGIDDISATDGTKAVYDLSDKKFKFEKGDKIGISYNEFRSEDFPEFGRNVPFTCISADPATGTYEFGGALIDDDNEYVFIAYYPYNPDFTVGSTSSNIFFTPYTSASLPPRYCITDVQVAAEQDYYADGWKGGPMGAYFQGKAEDLALTFKPHYGVMKFTVEIPEDADVSYDEITVKAIVLQSRDSHNQMAQHLKYYFFTNEEEVTEVKPIYVVAGATSLTLNCPEQGITIGKGEKHDFYIMSNRYAVLSKGMKAVIIINDNQPVSFIFEDKIEEGGIPMNQITSFPTIKFDRELTADPE